MRSLLQEFVHSLQSGGSGAIDPISRLYRLRGVLVHRGTLHLFVVVVFGCLPSWSFSIVWDMLFELRCRHM
jgi:hypothetical protein